MFNIEYYDDEIRIALYNEETVLDALLAVFKEHNPKVEPTFDNMNKWLYSIYKK